MRGSKVLMMLIMIILPEYVLQGRHPIFLQELERIFGSRRRAKAWPRWSLVDKLPQGRSLHRGGWRHKLFREYFIITKFKVELWVKILTAELLRSLTWVVPPSFQADRWNRGCSSPAAGGSHIRQLVGLEEGKRLELFNIVHAVTDHPGKGGLSDLLKLRRTESTRVSSSFVPEPVALPQVEELLADDASKGWPNDPTHHGLLGHPAGEEVNVVDMLVNILDPCHRSGIHHRLQLLPRSEPLQPALFAPNVVRSQPVVAASLKI